MPIVIPWLKKPGSAKAKQKHLAGQFRRNELPEKDLARLALAHMFSGSPDLRKAAAIVSRFRELDISEAPEFNEEVIRMACRLLVTLAEEGSSAIHRQRLVRILQEADDALPTLRDSKQNTVQVNKALSDLKLRLQEHFSEVVSRPENGRKSNTWSVLGPAIAHSIALLEVVKEAADLTPIPVLKPAVGTVIGLLKLVKDFRANYAPLDHLTTTTAKFILLVAEEISGNTSLSMSFQVQLDSFTCTLRTILETCERIRGQSTMKKFLFQHSDKELISRALQDLQNAIESFKMTNLIKQKCDLEMIVREVENTCGSIGELLDITGLVLLQSLQLTASKISILPDNSYFPHSRDNEIDHIRTWAVAGNSRFLWVQGSAAMGKSTLMRHLTDVFEEEGRLGSYCFFEPESQIDFLSVAKHMAYEMALLHPYIRTAMSKITPLPQNQKLHEHLLHLVIQPLSTLPQDSVIIIDALDQHQRPQALLVGLQTALEFAPNVKVLFTARANSNILRWTSSNDSVETYTLPPFDHAKMKEYLQTQFGGISDWVDGCPSEEQVERLVSMADGHIGWAVYASVLISDHREIPDDMLGSVLDKNPIEKLDALYLEILKPLLKNHDRSRKVLGMLLVIEEPLSREALNQLAYTHRLKIDEVYNRLCLLRKRGKEYITPITQHFHSSILEFLRDERRCGTELYPIPSPDAHLLLFRCSARLLEHSSRPGTDTAISYAYDWWPHHIAHAFPDLDDDYVPFPDDICHQVLNFVSTSSSGYFDSQLRKFQSKISPPDVDTVEQLHWLTSEAVRGKWWSKSDKPLAALSHLVSLQQVVVRLSPSSIQDKVHILGRLFHYRYVGFWSVDDLERAIHAYHKAFLLSNSHPDRSILAINLCGTLQTRHRSKGNSNGLEDAIEFGREALAFCEPPHPDRGACLTNLAIALGYRFELQRDLHDLDEAIQLHSEALVLCPAPHSGRSTSLNNLANALRSRFQLRGDTHDLDKAIQFHSEALVLRPAPHPDRSRSLNNLANALKSRFELKGNSQADLDRVIELHSEALALCPAQHPDRSKSLYNLANALQSRFRLQGNAQDLDDAIKLHREALTLRPVPHPDRSMSLSNLGLALKSRFESRNNESDLNEAIFLHREALALWLQSHPFRGAALYNLALALRTRFEHNLGSTGDLREAVEFLQEAVCLTPASHPRWKRRKAELDKCLGLLEQSARMTRTN